jgi:hypothetical protein
MNAVDQVTVNSDSVTWHPVEPRDAVPADVACLVDAALKE